MRIITLELMRARFFCPDRQADRLAEVAAASIEQSMQAAEIDDLLDDRSRKWAADLCSWLAPR
jgi:hypothetical protein